MGSPFNNDSNTGDDIGLNFIMNQKKKAASNIMSASASDGGGSNFGSNGGGGGYIESDRHSRIISSGSDSGDDSSTNDGFASNGGGGGGGGRGGNGHGHSRNQPETDSDDGQAEPTKEGMASPNFFTRKPNPMEQYEQHSNRMSESQVNNLKSEMLYQFGRLEKKGVRLPRKYNMASDVEDMKADLDRIRRDRKVDASVKYQRNITIGFSNIVEIVNAKFDPIGAKLDGYSDKVTEEIDEYDDIFEEIHDKYGSSDSNLAPEFRLAMGLASSCFMCHVSNKMTNDMPGFASVMKGNPDLMRQFAGATAQTMADSGGENAPAASMFASMFGSGNAPQNSQPMQPPASSTQNRSTQQSSMRGPGKVDDILNEMNIGDRIETFSTLTDSETSSIRDGGIEGMLNGTNGRGILDI